MDRRSMRIALQDVNAYAATHPDCTAFNGDMNGDLKVDAGDIEGFLRCVSHGGCP